MALIEVRGSNFRDGFTHLNGSFQEDISNLDFIRAIVTLGAQSYIDLFRGRWWRGVPYRIFNGLASLLLLDFSAGLVRLDPAYRELDMSEKSIASYWMGMGFTKLIAERLLDVPWLVHIDYLNACGALETIPLGGTRGDLAGLDYDANWHILEAKGRSQRVQPNIIQDAKDQASSVLSINGKPPVTTSASIARLFTQPISVLLDDPKQNEKGEYWKIDKNKFIEAYYQPFIDKLKESEHKEVSISNYKVSFFKVDLFDEYYLFGILSNIVRNPLDAPDICYKTTYDVKFLPGLASFFKTQKESISVGKDGLILIQVQV